MAPKDGFGTACAAPATGGYEAVSSETALDEVAEPLQAIVQRHGGQSVGLN